MGMVADPGPDRMDGPGRGAGADRGPVDTGAPRSAVGLTPQHRARLQRVKDKMFRESGRDHTHIEAFEYLLAYWEAREGNEGR